MARFHHLSGVRLDPDPPNPIPILDELGNVTGWTPNPLPSPKTSPELGSPTKSPEQSPSKGKR